MWARFKMFDLPETERDAAGAVDLCTLKSFVFNVPLNYSAETQQKHKGSSM